MGSKKTLQAQARRRMRLKAPSTPWSKKHLLVLVASFAIIGTALLILSHAQGNTASIEPENGAVSGNAGTLTDSSASGTGGIVFGQKDMFVSTTGNDSKDGSSLANAVKTISKAVQLANGRTRIRIMTGTYIETVRIQKDNITLQPYGNGDVTINGAIPELISGAGISWAADSAGVYTTSLPLNRNEATTETNAIYDSQGKQLWSYYNNLTSMANTGSNYPGAPGAPRPGAALYNFLFTNYIKVRTNAGAPTVPLYIGAQLPTIDILNANNINLTSISGSKLKLVYGSQNVQIRDSNKIKINDLDITGGTYGIALYNSSNVSITKNKIHGAFGRDINYKEVKEYTGGLKTMENAAIKTSATTKDMSKIVIDANELTGYWAAISMFTEYGRNGVTTKYHTDDSVISNNLVHDMDGVGIEPEIPARNLVIKGNTVYDTFEPFSPAPAFVGPTYVYENLFVANRSLLYDPYTLEVWGPSYSIKMNNDTVAPPENIHYYYNTFYYAGNSGNRRLTVHTTPDAITKNVSFTNNIFYSYENGIIRGSGRLQDGVQWDGNIFYSANWAYENYFSWNIFYDAADITHRFATLQDLKNAGAMPAEWAANAEGNPSFNCVDPTNSSCFRPSAAITKPASLQPVTNGFPEFSRFNTSRTRIGAFE